MSEMAKKARRDMRAKINRITSTPKGKVDASGWEPPEPLKAGRKVYDKAKERSATSKIYKHGGRIQGDRGPRRKDKLARGGKADGGVPSSRFAEDPVVSHSTFMNRGGKTGCEHMAKGGATRTGNRSGDGYVEGTRPTGGRIARARGGKTGNSDIVFKHDNEGGFTVGHTKTRRTAYAYPSSPSATEAKQNPERTAADMLSRSGSTTYPDYDSRNWARLDESRAKRAHGGRAKGKTNIVINVGEKQPQMAMPPIQAPTRPPMPPPGPPPGAPPGGPPGMPGGPPVPPPSMAGGMPPGMSHKRGGRALTPKQGIDVPMKAGAGGGLGRIAKAKAYGATQR